MVCIELKTLFSPKKIGNVEIKNRIVRSATELAAADDAGYVTDEYIDMYKKLAEGGVGLIITEVTAIDEEGKIQRQKQKCLFDDSFIEGNKKLCDAVHEYSDVKIAPQLNHAGRQGPNGVAPHPYTYKVIGKEKPCRPMSADDIQKLIKDFGSAARRAYESGYDMVQLNGGHGWLLNNFQSAYINQRTDEYGGSIEARTKVLVDIYNEIKDQAGKDFPVCIKINGQDFVEGGITFDEAEVITKILVDTGYAAIEPSGGGGVTIFQDPSYPFVIVKSPDQENYFLETVKRLKPVMKDVPVMLMGGVRNPEIAEKLLQEGTIEFISMSRPFIYEPGLPNRWKCGDTSPAFCTSCNKCLPTSRPGPVYCPIQRKAEKRKKRLEAEGKA